MFSIIFNSFSIIKRQFGEIVVTYPTVGLQMEEVNYKNLKFNIWDLGGQESYRKSWNVYYAGTSFIILVIDSADTDQRMKIIREELFQLLVHEDLKNTKILILANKQDKKDARSASEVSKILNLHKIHDHEWNIQSCCTLTGEGVMEGLEWISQKTQELKIQK